MGIPIPGSSIIALIPGYYGGVRALWVPNTPTDHASKISQSTLRSLQSGKVSEYTDAYKLKSSESYGQGDLRVTKTILVESHMPTMNSSSKLRGKY
jgi:hypothetical protein